MKALWWSLFCGGLALGIGATLVLNLTHTSNTNEVSKILLFALFFALQLIAVVTCAACFCLGMTDVLVVIRRTINSILITAFGIGLGLVLATAFFDSRMFSDVLAGALSLGLGIAIVALIYVIVLTMVRYGVKQLKNDEVKL